MHAVIFLILQIINILWWFIIIGVVMSWLVAFNVINLHNQFIYSIYSTVEGILEPMLRPIRKLLPDLGGIDISPIILLLLLEFLRVLIINDISPRLGVSVYG